MKKLLLLTLLLPGIGFAQARFSHLNTIELGKMKARQVERIAKAPGRSMAVSPETEADNTPLTIFMRVSDDATVARVEAAGGEVSLRAGNIILVETTIGQAEAIAATEGMVTVSLPEQLRMNEFQSAVGYDLSRQHLGLDKIQSGAAPLPQAYGGKGAIVGIIDGGIDPNHIMFDDEEGNPRVKRIMNHVEVSGKSFTQKSETPETVRQFKSDNNYNTHGTHVMGIAAGSFKNEADGINLTGAAPQADIAIKCGITDNARLIKGLDYLTGYAAEEGKPIAINISLGSNLGPHDGTDEFPAALQEYAKKDGVTICVSASNEGADGAFMYHECDGENPMRTFILNSAYTDYLYSQVTMLPMFPQAIGSMQIWSDDDTPFDLYFDYCKFPDEANVAPETLSSFKLEPFKTCYLSTTGRSPVTAPDIFKGDDEVFNTYYRNSFIGGASALYPANNRYYAEINFQLECPDQASFMHGLVSIRIVPGKPGQKFYVYGQPMGMYFGFRLHSGYMEQYGFKGSDGDGSINAMAGAKDVITVGSYTTHNFFENVADQVTIGTTSSFSSWGHTPDGRVHPLISAPGHLIVSSMSGHYFDTNLKGTEDADNEAAVYYRHTDKNNKTHYWTTMSGTSMSSPYMTGIAATWLAADPTLTTADILRIARETADSPKAPRENDGPGLFVNAFRGLCKVLNLSGINNVANDDEDAPYSLLRSGNTFTVQAPAAASIKAEVYSLGGVLALATAADDQELTVDASTLAPGIYVMSLRIGNSLHSEKIAVR